MPCLGDSSNTSADPVTGKGEITRVAKGPAGYVGISGSWRTSKFENVSDNVRGNDKRDGKVISVARLMVAADGKTITIDLSDKLHGTTGQFVAEKQ